MLNMRRLCPSLGLFPLCLLLACVTTSPPPVCTLDDTEIAVLAAATVGAPCYADDEARGYFLDPFPETHSVDGQTLGTSDELRFLREMEGWPYQGALSDLGNRAESLCLIPPTTRLADALKARLTPDGTAWAKYSESDRSSCGLASFSRVGFSSDRTRAVVYRVVYKRPLAAVGHLVTLHFEAGRWVVDGAHFLWIS